MGKKGGKKGKKGKGDAGPQPVTNELIRRARLGMMCPRLGDIYTRMMHVEGILEDVSEKVMLKAASKHANVLNLAGMRMVKLPELLKLSPELKGLVDLNLSKNNLFNSDQVFEVLYDLPQLVRLDVSFNVLNGTLTGLVGRLDQLEELHLDSNNLVALPASISGMRALTVLSVADNLLTGLPPELGDCSALRQLNCKNNKIASIPGAVFRSCTRLEKMQFSGNLLKAIPEEIGCCINAVLVDFSCNAIEELPPSLAQCVNIEVLHFGSNKIPAIAPEIFSSLVKLREVQLFKNKITVVPAEIGFLTQVERISLSGNNLKTLPEEIGSCTALQELYLANNAKFSSLPSSAGHLRRLQELVLRKCPALKQLPASVADLEELRELDLRAPKKQVCKITPEFVQALELNQCKVRGGLVKKAKGGGKKGKK